MNQRGRGLFVALFLAPAALIYALFVVYPLGQALAFSLYSWRGVSQHKTYVGTKNFTDLFGEPGFHKALQNNLELLFVGGFCTIAMAIALAHGLQGKGKTVRTLRGIILFPQIISVVVVATLWMFIYNPRIGLVTSGMNALHLDRFVHTWIGEPETALGAVGVSFVWFAVGFYVMLFAAALGGLPAEVTEAAELDGAVGFRRFRQVTWPMLWSVKRIAIVHLTITVMNTFALVHLMTNGGPDRSTETLLTYLYERAFNDSQFGSATSIAVVNFFIVAIVSVLILVWLRKDPEVAR